MTQDRCCIMGDRWQQWGCSVLWRTQTPLICVHAHTQGRWRVGLCHPEWAHSTLFRWSFISCGTQQSGVTNATFSRNSSDWIVHQVHCLFFFYFFLHCDHILWPYIVTACHIIYELDNWFKNFILLVRQVLLLTFWNISKADVRLGSFTLGCVSTSVTSQIILLCATINTALKEDQWLWYSWGLHNIE